ncbi:LytTR family DNA-binding domain-containing protein [Flavobacteriaceae bacterium S356]|uniref:LytTR family DNA-binding domain-containing protein n=1 Tax=Asprobacillus argus TaxID=3076534 RepID=A0ABU3LDS0_9FLAO|nr:LytTR family DNA-binding domain-containing protein [Flavobacteriaceae bacterium S356]
MKVLIIDDEKSARNLIETMLLDVCPEVKTILKAADLETGIQTIHKEAPEVVFLDVEMPKYSGLRILDFFEDKEVDFQIVFITAYDKYAIEAFKLSAIDYLLKPVDVDELKNAVGKTIRHLGNKKVSSKLENLKKSIQHLKLNTLPLEVPKGISFVSYDDILYFEADAMYTKVHMKDQSIELVSKPLKYFSDQLEGNDFFYKCHRSYLVSLKHIKQFLKQDGGYIVMSNGNNIPIAKNKKEEFMKCIQTLF